MSLDSCRKDAEEYQTLGVTQLQSKAGERKRLLAVCHRESVRKLRLSQSLGWDLLLST